MSNDTNGLISVEKTYVSALAELLVGSGHGKDKLADAKWEALLKTRSLLRRYEEENFDSKIINTIMEKKAKLILEAKTKKDLMEIVAPPKPYYNGNRWIISENSVPEEEMLLWAMVSAHVMLRPEATKRYMELFQEYYGFGPEELCGKAVTRNPVAREGGGNCDGKA